MDLSKIFENISLDKGILWITFGYMFSYIKGLLTSIFRFIKGLFVTTVVIDSESEAYAWVKNWLANTQASNSKTLIGYTSNDIDDYNGFNYKNVIKPKILFSLGYGFHYMFFNNIYIFMNSSSNKVIDSHGHTNFDKTYEFTFLTKNRSIIDAFFEQISELEFERRTKNISLRLYNFDHWSNDDTAIVDRRLDSIILKEGMKEELLEDISLFLTNNEWYRSVGIPHRRSYLLYGPPGTGKTALISAIANHFKFNIHVLSVSSTFGDLDLLKAISKIPGRSILLLEDIDCSMPVEREKKENQKLTTFSGILNAIDGITDSSCRLIFMTTNYPEKLDGALIRKGRIDKNICLDYFDSYQINAMIDKFFPGDYFDRAKINEFFKDKKVPGAQLQDVLVRLYNRKTKDNLTEQLMEIYDEESRGPDHRSNS